MATKTTKPSRKTTAPRARESSRKRLRVQSKNAASRTVRTKSSKTDQCLAMLRQSEGVTVADLMAATGWQAHSVRGFLSGTVRKKLGLDLQSSKSNGEARRYHVEG